MTDKVDASFEAAGVWLSGFSVICRAALANTKILTPRIPVISNVDVQPHSDPEVIKDILARQVRPHLSQGSC